MQNKILEGQFEPIVDPDLEIVDAHHHLFDRPNFRYMFDDLLRDTCRGHRIKATVYVETLSMARATGPQWLRPIGEVEFANGVAAMSACGVYGPLRACAAIVGHADLRHGENVGRYLDRALGVAPERFRGIRQNTVSHPSEVPYRFMSHAPDRDILLDPRFRLGFKELARRNLSFDAVVFHHQLHDIGQLAQDFPDTPIVLNHMGMAMAMGMEAAGRRQVFNAWRTALKALALHPNVVCKVGGLGLPFWGFGLENRNEPTGSEELEILWKPYVREAIEAFGPSRCMMESNFPQDSWSCGYVPLWNALKRIVNDMTSDEREMLFSKTAQRIYRIEVDA